MPDTCCHTVTVNCGRGIFKDSTEQILNRIFVHGCLTVLQDQLENDVVPMMVGYAVVGVILALVELITIVLASAFVAQITRYFFRLLHFKLEYLKSLFFSVVQEICFSNLLNYF